MKRTLILIEKCCWANDTLPQEKTSSVTEFRFLKHPIEIQNAQNASLPSTSPCSSYKAASPHTLTFKIKNPVSYMISLFLFCLINCAFFFPGLAIIHYELTLIWITLKTQPCFHVKLCTAHFSNKSTHLNSNYSPLFAANLFSS